MERGQRARPARVVRDQLPSDGPGRPRYRHRSSRWSNWTRASGCSRTSSARQLSPLRCRWTAEVRVGFEPRGDWQLPVFQPGRCVMTSMHGGDIAVVGRSRDHRTRCHSRGVDDGTARRRGPQRARRRRPVHRRRRRTWRPPGRLPMEVSHYLGIRPRWIDGTMVGGCSFMLHVRHAASAIASGAATTVLITHGESGRSRVGVQRYSAMATDTMSGQFEMRRMARCRRTSRSPCRRCGSCTSAG